MRKPPALLALVLGATLGACASDPDPSTVVFQIEPASYDSVFNAARETLIDARFPIERVDARAGVLTTGSKPSAGLATPWDTEQGTLTQELEDFLNTTSRSVRITFEPLAERLAPDPPGRSAAADPEPAPDMTAQTDPIVVEVRVALERTRRPGWRPEPSGIGLTTSTLDPELARRGMTPTYTEPVGQDGRLARRLADQIRRRAGVAEPDPDAAPEASG